MRLYGKRFVMASLFCTFTLTAAACGASEAVKMEVAARGSGGVPGAATFGTAEGTPGAATGMESGVPGAEVDAGTNGPADANEGSGAGQATETGGTARGSQASAQGGQGGTADSAPPAQGGNGGATDVGVTADTIKIGGTYFNGGFLDKYSQSSEQAAKAYFNYVNDQGGVYGRKIDYISCDTQGTVNGTQACVKKLVKQDKVFMLGPGLDFNMDTVVPIATKQKIPWVGTAGLYDAEFTSPYLFPTMLHGRQVGNMMATFATKKLGVKSIGVSWLQNGAGPACLDQIKRLASKLGYQVKGDASNGDTESDLGGQVSKIKQENPDIIVFCNDPVNNIKFIQAAARQNYEPPKGWIQGFGTADDVPQAIGKAAVGMYGFDPFDFFKADTPGMKKYRAIIANYYPNTFYYTYSQQTYAGAIAAVQALIKTGPKLTRAGLQQAIKGMTKFDTEMGLKFNFGNLAGSRPSGTFARVDDNLEYQQHTGRLQGTAG